MKIRHFENRKGWTCPQLRPCRVQAIISDVGRLVLSSSMIVPDMKRFAKSGTFLEAMIMLLAHVLAKRSSEVV
jgi:hypothetical protein